MRYFLQLLNYPLQLSYSATDYIILHYLFLPLGIVTESTSGFTVISSYPLGGGDYMEIIPLMYALPLSTSHSNKWVNWLCAIKKLNETNKMCVLIFLDGYFVWGLVDMRKPFTPHGVQSQHLTLLTFQGFPVIFPWTFRHMPQIVKKWKPQWKYFQSAGY